MRYLLYMATVVYDKKIYLTIIFVEIIIEIIAEGIVTWLYVLYYDTFISDDL